MKKLLSIVGLGSILGLSSMVNVHANEQNLEENTSEVINTANLRESPTALSHKLGKVNRDENVQIKEVNNGWAKVVTDKGREGWISGYTVTGEVDKSGHIINDTGSNKTVADSIKAKKGNVKGSYTSRMPVITDKMIKNSKTSNKNYVTDFDVVKEKDKANYNIKKVNNMRASATVNGLNLRSNPSMGDNRIGSIGMNDNFTIVAESDGWYKIVTDDGREGWAYGSYINKGQINKAINKNKVTENNTETKTNVKASLKPNFNEKIDSNNSVVNTAKSLLGTKYVWGGTTTSGFDCSGFTQYVYKKALGKDIPRVSKAQANAGRPVSMDKLAVGDLLYFDTLGRGTTSHVGIYVGNGKFIHASGSATNPEFVKTSSLSEKWVKCLGARRI